MEKFKRKKVKRHTDNTRRNRAAQRNAKRGIL